MAAAVIVGLEWDGPGHVFYLHPSFFDAKRTDLLQPHRDRNETLRHGRTDCWVPGVTRVRTVADK